MRKLALPLLLFFASACESETERHFEVITDRDSLRITLDRSECFGYCPSYIVEVTGDGSVNYCGEAYVEQTGLRSRTISRDEVKALFDFIIDSGFSELEDRYEANISDGAVIQVKLEYDKQSKRVLDYYGLEAGMPDGVVLLQDKIDEIAGTRQWIGDASTAEFTYPIERFSCSTRLENRYW